MRDFPDDLRDYQALFDEYVDAVQSGRRIAGRLERLAIERHRRDMQAVADGVSPFVFDWSEVTRVCCFIETLRHVEGDLASRGETIRLDGWQIFVHGSLHGWLHADTRRRRFRIGYNEVARKNGKTTGILAPLSLYHLTMDGEAGPKCYFAAAKMKQARIGFALAGRMAETAPIFRSRFGVKVERHRIKLTDDVSEIVPLEAATLDGLNPHFSAVDELHEHKNRRVWDALQSAMGARGQPLLLAITTAGYDTASVCYELHDYARRVLEGVFTDDSFFGLIFAADEGDDPMAPETWAKANPSMGTAKHSAAIEAEALKAQGSPAYMGEFLRKHLNVWTSVGESAIDIDGWRAGFDPDMTLHNAENVVLGVDLSKSDDMSAVAAVAWRGDRLLVRVRHFVAEAIANLPGNDHLKAWGRSGAVTVCPGARIDLAAVDATIRDDAAALSAQEIAFDPHFGEVMMQAQAADGLPVVELRQTPMNLDLAFDRLMSLAKEGRVVTDGDPVLLWQAGNLVAQRRGEFLRPDKISPKAKIDGMVAVITALARLEAPEEAPQPFPGVALL